MIVLDLWHHTKHVLLLDYCHLYIWYANATVMLCNVLIKLFYGVEGKKQGKKHRAGSDVGHHEPTVSGRTTDPQSRTTSVSTDESSVLDNGSTIIKLKNRETLFASRSEDMSMIAMRPPDDVEEAKAMLARASALGTQMLVKPPSPPPIPEDTESMGEDKTQLSALVGQSFTLTLKLKCVLICRTESQQILGENLVYIACICLHVKHPRVILALD